MVALPEDTVSEMRMKPAAVFDTPSAVVDDGRLSRRQKREILEAWALDCREQSTADDEGMPARSTASGTLLKSVEDALAALQD